VRRQPHLGALSHAFPARARSCHRLAPRCRCGARERAHRTLQAALCVLAGHERCSERVNARFLPFRQVIMKGEKELVGTLRGFDVYVNMVLEDVTE
jgi:hypothetical protein